MRRAVRSVVSHQQRQKIACSLFCRLVTVTNEHLHQIRKGRAVTFYLASLDTSSFSCSIVPPHVSESSGISAIVSLFATHRSVCFQSSPVRIVHFDRVQADPSGISKEFALSSPHATHLPVRNDKNVNDRTGCVRSPSNSWRNG